MSILGKLKITLPTPMAKKASLHVSVLQAPDPKKALEAVVSQQGALATGQGLSLAERLQAVSADTATSTHKAVEFFKALGDTGTISDLLRRWNGEDIKIYYIRVSQPNVRITTTDFNEVSTEIIQDSVLNVWANTLELAHTTVMSLAFGHELRDSETFEFGKFSNSLVNVLRNFKEVPLTTEMFIRGSTLAYADAAKLVFLTTNPPYRCDMIQARIFQHALDNFSLGMTSLLADMEQSYLAQIAQDEDELIVQCVRGLDQAFKAMSLKQHMQETRHQQEMAVQRQRLTMYERSVVKSRESLSLFAQASSSRTGEIDGTLGMAGGYHDPAQLAYAAASSIEQQQAAYYASQAGAAASSQESVAVITPPPPAQVINVVMMEQSAAPLGDSDTEMKQFNGNKRSAASSDQDDSEIDAEEMRGVVLSARGGSKFTPMPPVPRLTPMPPGSLISRSRKNGRDRTHTKIANPQDPITAENTSTLDAGMVSGRGQHFDPLNVAATLHQDS